MSFTPHVYCKREGTIESVVYNNEKVLYSDTSTSNDYLHYLPHYLHYTCNAEAVCPLSKLC